MTAEDYNDLDIVRMAIVERDDRLVVLMPIGTEQSRLDEFVDEVERLGWPHGRIMVMCGPEAFAVLKPSKDEGESAKEQPEGDQIDPGDADPESSNGEADRSDDPKQDVQSDGHSSGHTPSGSCVHDIAWAEMSYSHFATEHKIDHP